MTQVEPSKLNCGGDAVKRAPMRRPRRVMSGSRKSLGLLDRNVAVRRLQDCWYISGEATIHGPHGEALRPHSVVGQAMNADECGRGELPTELSQIGEADEFEIDDGERGPDSGYRAPNFVQAVGSCDNVKLFLNRPDEYVGECRIAVSENDMDLPHGSTPSLSRDRRMAAKR